MDSDNNINSNNNNNNNNNNNKRLLLEDELEKKSLKSIKNIAQSFGIERVNLNKEGMIEKIKSVIKRKREYEVQKQKENDSPFNKIIKLTITDNIEPTEILFWKLFRNKTIFKEIFSFMDKRFSINYDSMSSIGNLISNNQFNILKEKVYRNCKYLHLDSKTKPYRFELSLLVKLFSTIKDNDDHKFYRNFLNGENYYYNSFSAVSKALIISKNLEIYKLYINEFGYETTKTDLIYSIAVGSNKFIKYILELNSTNSSSSNMEPLVSEEFIIDFQIQKDKIFKGLFGFLNIIGHHDNCREITGNKRMKISSGNSSDSNGYKEYEHQITINTLIKLIKNRGNRSGSYEINEKSTLKTLITICKLILILKEPKFSKTETIIIDPEDNDLRIKKEKLNNSFKSVPTSIQEIDNFINEKIDKQTLKSKLDNPIIYNNNNNNNNNINNEIKIFIKKLLYLYYSIFRHIPRILYFCYYYDDDEFDSKTNQDHKEMINDDDDDDCDCDDDDDCDCDDIDYMEDVAFRFGIYKFLRYKQFIRYYHILPNQINNTLVGSNFPFSDQICSEKHVVLFSHCFDQDKKIKFIDQMIERNITNTEYNFQNHFFYMLVIHGDIELLKYFSNKVGTPLSVYDSYKYKLNKLLPPTYYIGSIEMIDYLFNNHRNYFFDPQFPNYYCTFYKSLQFLQHFESLLIQYKLNNPSITEKDPIIFFKSHLSEDILEFIKDKDILDFANHFATNSVYQNDTPEFVPLFLSLLTSDQSSTQSFKFETFRNFFVLLQQPHDNNNNNNNNNNYYYYYNKIKNNDNKTYEIGFLKFLDWVFINHPSELKDGGKLFNDEDRYYHSLIAIDRYDFDNSNYNKTIRCYYYIKNDTDLDRLSSLIDYVNRFTPFLYEANNFKFLDWFLTKIQYYHNISHLTPVQKEEIKDMVCEFLKSIASFSRLKVFEYIHQNYEFILKNKFDRGIIDYVDLQDVLRLSIKKGSFKVSDFIFQFTTLPRIEQEAYLNEIS
ncbi:hypothetical protein ACTFIW_011142 [Dictyostelium discoideum]